MEISAQHFITVISLVSCGIFLGGAVAAANWAGKCERDSLAALPGAVIMTISSVVLAIVSLVIFLLSFSRIWVQIFPTFP